MARRARPGKSWEAQMRMSALGPCFLSLFILAIPAAGIPQKPSQSATNPPAKAVAPAAPAAQAEPTQEISGTKLPVRRVVLYKTGVGFFEHLGSIRGDQTVRIDFTSGQLNDVLQSLTVLDLNGGRISAVNYNSEAPLSQRLGTLHLPLTENTDLLKFYGALRGARLEIRSGTNIIAGRLL